MTTVVLPARVDQERLRLQVQARLPRTQGQPMIGDPAPEFTLTGIDGKTYALADYLGKFLAIHFGTSW